MNKWRKKFLAVILCMGLGTLGMSGCGKDGGQETAVQETKNGGENREADSGSDLGANSQSDTKEGKYLIKGADISSLEAVEDYGGKFYDFDGKEVDVISFLMDNGCNYFRLRIWNDPTMSFDAGDYCNLEHTLKTAKRIKAAGADYLLDFHYSDWWADPENQTVPEKWKDMSKEEMVQAVYDYTCEVLNELAKEDAYPDMVQIGNEIGNGMLWPYGSMDNPEALAAFLNSGIRAVRDTTPAGQDTKIMIHVQTGGSVGATENFFQTIEDNGVTDYDIVGLSYYPYWQGSFADMKENVDNIYETFGKQTVLAETAYPFTNDNADSKSNMVSEADLKSVGIEASVENQRLALELTMNAVSECKGGLGLFYWEPAWLAVEGAGVSKGSGNEWENQTLFDFEGKALDAVRAFAFEPGSLDNEKAICVYPFDLVEIDEKASEEDLVLELPKAARVLYMDGSIREVEVTWDIASKKTITDTHVAFSGTVLDFPVSVGAELIDKNRLNNLDFEDGNTGWIVEDTKKAGQIDKESADNAHSGEWSFHYWNADTFDINLYQQVLIEETDEYHLQVWSQGVGDSDLLLTLYIADADGNILAETEFQNAGWSVWQHPSVTADLQEGDIVRLGVLVHAGRDDWGSLDEFTFGTEEPEVQAENESGQGTVSEAPESTGGNLLANASFENGENGWDITRENTGSGTVRNDSEGNPYTGDYSFHYWNDSDFTIEVSQEVTVKEAGNYCLSSYSQGDSTTETTMTLFVKDADGKIIASTDFSNKGWDMWQNPKVEGITLKEGEVVTVGIVINGKADGWGTLDDISLSIE